VFVCARPHHVGQRQQRHVGEKEKEFFEEASNATEANFSSSLSENSRETMAVVAAVSFFSFFFFAVGPLCTFPATANTSQKEKERDTSFTTVAFERREKAGGISMKKEERAYLATGRKELIACRE